MSSSRNVLIARFSQILTLTLRTGMTKGEIYGIVNISAVKTKAALKINEPHRIGYEEDEGMAPLQIIQDLRDN